MKTNSLPKFIKESPKINIIGPCPLSAGPIDHTLPSIILDGGMNHQLELKKKYSIGDGDSTKYQLDITLPTEKDQSDLSWALESLRESKKEVFLHGLLGGRRDHELINIGELYWFCHKSGSTANFEDKILIIPIGSNTLSINGTFSLVSLKKAVITIKGQAKYQLLTETVINPISSHGLSNIGSGEITISSDSPLIIYIVEPSLI